MNFEVTVLMPVYNGEKYIAEAIESILNQSFKEFEFLIVNDGSTDRSLEIIQSYTDPRIKVINQKNGGVSNALNTGLKNATGKYIARMDADDLSHELRLEKQYNFMKSNPDYILVGSDANCIEENGAFIFRHQSGIYEDNLIKAEIHNSCIYVHSSVFFIKEAVIEVGMYDERAHSFEDHLLWSKLASKGKFSILPEELVDYRFNLSSVTIDHKDYDKAFLETKEEILKTGTVSERQEKIIIESLKKVDKRKKEISYYRLLSKKYLWNNYNPKKSRFNIRKSIQLEKGNPTSYILFLMSFLPKRVISFIYTNLKK